MRTIPLLLLGCLLFLANSLLHATHNRAGQITYEQIAPNTIRMTITTYTKVSPPSNAADRPDLTVDWGDNTQQVVLRTADAMIYPDIKRNTYVAVHTYPGPNLPGQPYIVSMQDPNRNDNVLNVNGGNSVNVEFYLQTEVYLFAPAVFGNNRSPIILQEPVDFGVVGQIFQYTPNAYDPDGDSVAYQLVTPMSNRGTPVPAFVPVTAIAPGNLNTTTFSQTTGLFTWNTPQREGEYNIAILIKSYRNGQYLGGVLQDIQIVIRNAQNTPPELQAPERLCIQAGDSVLFNVTAIDRDTPTQIVTLTATSGLFQLASSPATFASVTGNPAVSAFRWLSDCSHVQQLPYVVVFKARDTYFTNGGNTDASLATFKVVQIKVVAPPPKNLQATVSGGRVTLTWNAPYACAGSPNFFGFSVWRKAVCDPFTPDSCETGLDGRGYTRINPTLITTATGISYTFVDNDVTAGGIYSYRILAELGTPVYNNGQIVNYHSPVSSVPSNEQCVQMARDLPLMTNVDINATSTNAGQIFVQWSRPDALQLDTVQNPPPYRYELYRSEGLTGANFGTTPIYISPNRTSYFTAVDTFFNDLNGLNTTDNPYSYRVAFYANGDTLGYTSIASSVRLKVVGSDQQNFLTWQTNVPWTNSRYVVYQETPTGSGTFSVLDTVAVQNYTHSNLTNGQEYCYYIKSIGTYGIPNVLSPLYNKSQRACAIPIDSIPPCAPTGTVQIGGCENIPAGTFASNIFNTIRWNRSADTCSRDAAVFRVYFSQNCTGQYVRIAQSSNLSDTFFVHQPDTNNMAGCYYITTVDSIDGNGGGNESTPSPIVQTNNCPVYGLPNTFTPNGDGKNDVFRPFLPYRYISSIDFKVVNRWGETVFATQDPYIGWDGKDQSSDLPLAEGVYYYTCTVQQNTLPASEPILLKGYVQIIRNGGE